MSSNNLTNLPSSISNLCNLRQLLLSANLIKLLPDSIGQLSHLTELDISSNAITHLPVTMTQLTKLQDLGLRDTYLHLTAGDVISKLTALTSLQVGLLVMSELGL